MRVFKRLNRFAVGAVPSVQILAIEELTGTPHGVCGNPSHERQAGRSPSNGRPNSRSNEGRAATFILVCRYGFDGKD